MVVDGSKRTTKIMIGFSPLFLRATIRNDISFEQSKMAKTRGFHVSMRSVVLDTVEKRIERVKARGAAGGPQTPQRRKDDPRSNQDSDGAEEDAHLPQRP
jgi:predicted ABC-type ATPase